MPAGLAGQAWSRLVRRAHPRHQRADRGTSCAGAPAVELGRPGPGAGGTIGDRRRSSIVTEATDAARVALAVIGAAGTAGLPTEFEPAVTNQVAALERRGLVERGAAGRLVATASGHQLLAAGAPAPTSASTWLPVELAAWQARLGISGAKGPAVRTVRDHLPSGRRYRDGLLGPVVLACRVIELVEA